MQIDFKDFLCFSFYVNYCIFFIFILCLFITNTCLFYLFDYLLKMFDYNSSNLTGRKFEFILYIIIFSN